MSIIAIDCGASFIKASRIVDSKIEQTVKVTAPSDMDDNKIEKSINIIKTIIEHLCEPEVEVRLGFSNEMHGFVLADEDGHAVTPYISWQKEFANEIYLDCTYVEYIKGLLGNSLIEKTGMQVKVGMPNVNLFYVLNNQLREYNKELYFYSLGDYYIRILSGKQPYIHQTNAAATGLYDIWGKCWCEDIISRIVGNKQIIFPELYDNQPAIKCEISGRKVGIYPAIGDQQAALYGSDLLYEKDISLNFGTGAQISVVTSKPELSSVYQIRPYFGGKYLKTIPHIPSGRAINVFFKMVKGVINQFADVSDEEIWSFINSQVKQNNLPNMKIDMSFFSNAITTNDKGSICGIDEYGFTIGNIFDSVYRQLADNIHYVYEKLGSPDVSRIIISGGVINKNECLRNRVLAKFNGIENIYYALDETVKGIAKFIDDVTGEA